ncbi:MAG TPA: biotin/lipoyl-containing protein [Acidisarcina sp.]|nr:biotin/lipoyl-containing protein [Acidisarcina sp.]
MMVNIELAGRLRTVQMEKGPNDGIYRVLLDGKEIEVQASLLRPGVLSLLLDGKAYRCVLEEDATGSAIHLGGHRYPYRLEDPRSLKSRLGKGVSAAGPVSIKAPMPGRVVRLMAAEGDEVAGQQGIVVIEAMKMQNELKAPKAGRVVRVLVQAGATVASGQPLAIVE